ncbi:hypothetical protein ACFLUV_03615 [Elusimicrobiota bacterium]
MKRELKIEIERFEERLFEEAREIILQKVGEKENELKMLKDRHEYLVNEYEDKTQTLEAENTKFRNDLNEKQRTVLEQKKEFREQLQNLEEEWAGVKRQLENRNRELLVQIEDTGKSSRKESAIIAELKGELQKTQEFYNKEKERRKREKKEFKDQIEGLINEINELSGTMKNQSRKIAGLEKEVLEYRMKKMKTPDVIEEEKKVHVLDEKLHTLEETNKSLAYRLREKEEIIQKEQEEEDSDILEIRERASKDISHLRRIFLAEDHETVVDDTEEVPEKDSKMEEARKLRREKDV